MARTWSPWSDNAITSNEYSRCTTTPTQKPRRVNPHFWRASGAPAETKPFKPNSKGKSLRSWMISSSGRNTQRPRSLLWNGWTRLWKYWKSRTRFYAIAPTRIMEPRENSALSQSQQGFRRTTWQGRVQAWESLKHGTTSISNSWKLRQRVECSVIPMSAIP